MVKYYAKNMELVAYHDLDKRPAFKLAMQVVDDRWYLYMGHFWHRGWTIMDVTDPANPQKVGWVDGPDNCVTVQLQVADGKMITALEWILPHLHDLDENKPKNEGILIWDVKEDPTRPKLLGHWKTGGNGTHRNHYDGGRYVHCAANMPGFDKNIYVIVDIEDPANPREVGRWFLPEQYLAGGGNPNGRWLSCHGPAWVVGDRAYVSWCKGGVIILDVSDFSNPKLVSRLDFGDGFGSSLGVHSVVPLVERKLLVVNTESIAEEFEEPLNFAGIVDIRDETNPRLISLFPLPEPPPEAPYKHFHKLGGKFGPHNQHHHNNQDCLYKSEERVYMTYFNAGLRVYDISDAYYPREIGYFVPDAPKERIGPRPIKLATQSEDVLVDARGYAYISDKNHGLFIVRYTGD